MDIDNSLALSASGLDVQRQRMNVIASNLANVNSSKSVNGGPFRRRDLLIRSAPVGRPFRNVLDAAVRQEPPGVQAELLCLIDVVDGIMTSRETGEVTRHYIMVDYAARWLSGEPVAGDDAVDARFFDLDEALAIVEWDVTRRVIQDAFDRFGA